MQKINYNLKLLLGMIGLIMGWICFNSCIYVDELQAVSEAAELEYIDDSKAEFLSLQIKNLIKIYK
jgi:hypothetical protein